MQMKTKKCGDRKEEKQEKQSYNGGKPRKARLESRKTKIIGDGVEENQ